MGPFMDFIQSAISNCLEGDTPTQEPQQHSVWLKLAEAAVEEVGRKGICMTLEDAVKDLADDDAWTDMIR